MSVFNYENKKATSKSNKLHLSLDFLFFYFSTDCFHDSARLSPSPRRVSQHHLGLRQSGRHSVGECLAHVLAATMSVCLY